MKNDLTQINEMIKFNKADDIIFDMKYIIDTYQKSAYQ